MQEHEDFFTGAVWGAALGTAFWGFLFGAVMYAIGPDEATPKLEQAARERKAITPEQHACLTQYGPGERWISSFPPSCAIAAGSVPEHILSRPVQ